MLQTAPQAHRFADFVLATRADQIPDKALERVQDLILDLIGVGAAARHIDASRLGREMAIRLFNAESDQDRARILFDGRTASLGGAAYAGAT
ncbi:MAG: MmgE/PrpD family protein, partial [Pseudomonadota bacterium]